MYVRHLYVWYILRRAARDGLGASDKQIVSNKGYQMTSNRILPPNMKVEHIPNLKKYLLKATQDYQPALDHGEDEDEKHEDPPNTNVSQEDDARTRAKKMIDYGPPQVKTHKYEYNPDYSKREPISQIDQEADQALKYLPAKFHNNVQRAAKAAEIAKKWCGTGEAMQAYPDCCGLLSTEHFMSEDKSGPADQRLIVAPIGIPLDEYVQAVKATGNALEPINRLSKNKTKFEECLKHAAQAPLMIARFISDLTRFINCCHASNYYFADSSADNFIIVCRRPEYDEIGCRRLMLMAIDFEGYEPLEYKTILPYQPPQSTAQEKLIMWRSLNAFDNLSIMAKPGLSSGRLPFGVIGQLTADGPWDWQLEETKKELECLKKTQYFDPVLEDRFQAIGNIILLLDALDHCRNNARKSSKWEDLGKIVTQYRSIAQGDQHVKRVVNFTEIEIPYKSNSNLSSLEATQAYLKECTKCEALWTRMCKLISRIVKEEKGTANETGNVFLACQDPTPWLDFEKRNNFESIAAKRKQGITESEESTQQQNVETCINNLHKMKNKNRQWLLRVKAAAAATTALSAATFAISKKRSAAARKKNASRR